MFSSIVSATEKCNHVVNAFLTQHGISPKVLENLGIPHSVEATAEAIILATNNRDKELYYPPNQMLYVSAVLRIMWPSLFEAMANSAIFQNTI